ncbi:serine/threonine protein kinase [Peltigera leucophlebia]|nr:serine/threonine protein kinase [Peltigera leucophlebia]
MGNLDLRVGGKYRLDRKIGSGSFGVVYLGLDDDTGDEVAIKLEHHSTEFSQLQNEVEFYKTLAGVAGIPRVHWDGDVDDYSVMVFDPRKCLDGIPIRREKLYHAKKAKFGGFNTFCLPSGPPGSQSPRDDMESLGYLMLYLHRGSLPWQQIKATTEERTLELIREMKETISTKDLCDGLPKEFAAYFNHVGSLQFGDKPRYSYLRRIFNNLFRHEGFEWDQVFDWTILKYSMAQSSAGDCRTDSL